MAGYVLIEYISQDYRSGSWCFVVARSGPNLSNVFIYQNFTDIRYKKIISKRSIPVFMSDMDFFGGGRVVGDPYFSREMDPDPVDRNPDPQPWLSIASGNK